MKKGQKEGTNRKGEGFTKDKGYFGNRGEGVPNGSEKDKKIKGRESELTARGVKKIQKKGTKKKGKCERGLQRGEEGVRKI